MADEAVLRIVVKEDQSATGLTDSGGTSSSPLASSPSSPPSQPSTNRQPAGQTNPQPGASRPAGGAAASDLALTAAAVAQKDASDLLRQQLRAASVGQPATSSAADQGAAAGPVAQDWAKPGPFVEPGSPADRRAKGLAGPPASLEQQPAAEPAFDPVAEAKRQIEREGRREQVADAYKQLKPPAAAAASTFDPAAEASAQHETEVRREQIKATYERMYGSAQQTASAFDLTLDFAQKMRGTLGGAFGALVGATLDIVASIRGVAPAAKSSARVEAERRLQVPGTSGQPNIARPESLAGGGSGGQPSASATQLATSAANAPQPVSGGAVATASGSIAPAAGGEAAAGAAVAGGESAAGAAAAAGGLATAAGAAAAALAPVAVAAVAVAIGMKAIDSVVSPLVQKYGEYNAQIARAQAMAEVRQTYGDIRRANENAPELAQYVELQSRMEQSFEDVKVALISRLLPIANSIMEIVTALMPFFDALLIPVKGILAVIEIVAEGIKKILIFLRIIKENQDDIAEGPAFDAASIAFPNI